MSKIRKRALVVDDEEHVRGAVSDCFTDQNSDATCPYEFDVDLAASGGEAKQALRRQAYDVVVLDIRLDAEHDEGGLELALSYGYPQREGHNPPAVIVFTAFANYDRCVRAIRAGAWDFIVKGTSKDLRMGVDVVRSAVAKLRGLDTRREQEEHIFGEWAQRNLRTIQQQHPDQLVAVWYDRASDQTEPVAIADDAFDLAPKLANWSKLHQPWEDPIVLRVASANGAPVAED